MWPSSMTQYHRLKRKRLSDLLVDEGLTSKEVVIAGLHEQKSRGGLLSSILLNDNALDAYDLARVIVEQFQVPFVDLERYTLHKDTIELFPAELLHRARIVPLEKFGKHFSFACQEIPSRELHDEIKEIVEGSVLVFASFARDIESALREHAPYESPVPEAVDVESIGSTVAEPVAESEDHEWQALFDTANEAIVGQINEDPEEP